MSKQHQRVQLIFLKAKLHLSLFSVQFIARLFPIEGKGIKALLVGQE